MITPPLTHLRVLDFTGHLGALCGKILADLLALGERAQAEIDEVVDAVAAFVARKSKAELYQAALHRSLLLAPVMDAADLLRDDQLAARAFFAAAHEPRLGRKVIHCGPFARLSATPLAAPRAAPRLGEGGEDAVREWSAPRVSTGPGAHSPLLGMRVIDFAWVVTGPITGRLLAEFGADVIRVESARRLDPGRTLQPWAEGKAGLNRSQMFANANAGKRSVTLDLARLEARDVARRLVAGADVVIESFTPGTMARWGLDYASVRALKPAIVYLSTCQQGQTGPHASYRGYGSLAAALAGFYTVTGWRPRPLARMTVAFRTATLDDAESVAVVYLRSRRELVAFAPLVHSEEAVRDWIRDALVASGRTTVAVVDGQVVGFLSVSKDAQGSWIDQLYLLPEWTGRGLGSEFLELARGALPPPIRLYTFQANQGARRFYERHGFGAVAFGDGSGNEERCPDVLYEWRPRRGVEHAAGGGVPSAHLGVGAIAPS